LVGLLEELDSFVDGALRSAIWQCIGEQVGSVGCTDALDPDAVCAVFALEVSRDNRTSGGTLSVLCEQEAVPGGAGLAKSTTYHVSGLATGSSKDEDCLGAGTSLALFKIVLGAGAEAELTGFQSVFRVRGRGGNG
jgi:hypothetical protein